MCAFPFFFTHFIIRHLQPIHCTSHSHLYEMSRMKKKKYCLVAHAWIWTLPIIWWNVKCQANANTNTKKGIKIDLMRARESSLCHSQEKAFERNLSYKLLNSTYISKYKKSPITRCRRVILFSLRIYYIFVFATARKIEHIYIFSNCHIFYAVCAMCAPFILEPWSASELWKFGIYAAAQRVHRAACILIYVCVKCLPHGSSIHTGNCS